MCGKFYIKDIYLCKWLYFITLKIQYIFKLVNLHGENLNKIIFNTNINLLFLFYTCIGVNSFSLEKYNSWLKREPRNIKKLPIAG